MKIYISGRITGNPNYMKQFAEAEEKTREYDIPCINPAKEPDPNKTWSDYMREDLALLLTCDTILMLKGWWRSRGARLERHIAKKLNMTVVYE